MKTKSTLCLLLAALLAALVTFPALAAVPKPSDEFYYLDQANVLTEATEGEIFFSNQLLNEACGAQIVVVTVKSTRPAEIDDYTYELFNQWGIGSSDKQNGFLLVLAIDDDNYYALCGTGLESKFSSGALNQCFDQYLEGDFAARRYDAGVKSFFEAVFQRVADIYSAKVTTAQGIAAYEAWAAEAAPAPRAASSGGAQLGNSYRGDEGGDSNNMIAIVTVLLIIVVALAISGRRRRTYYGGGGWFPFFLGSAMRRRTPPPPPPPHGSPMAGSGGYRGTPRSGSGLGGLFTSSGGGASRSSGAGRSSFGGGRSSGGSRSFGSARGGGGGTRGGGAGRGRH